MQKVTGVKDRGKFPRKIAIATFELRATHTPTTCAHTHGKRKERRGEERKVYREK